MRDEPARYWKDGEGWSAEDLVWTETDTRLVEASLRSGPPRPTSHAEIKSRIAARPGP
ncbi:hypothetical protein IBTHAUMO2_780004 [Nitrosopumilaceae archaeon]|nr:hypothetical protein [Nitrosopumilus sp.]CAI9832433.1 hypothetical protein IBTHAUMO2_780004 [Nitrosopumilaceae archaeon]